jgi:hypothetical protein
LLGNRPLIPIATRADRVISRGGKASVSVGSGERSPCARHGRAGRRAAIARAALVLVALIGGVRAQEVPRPWLGSAIRGQVVDADTGTPIAGAVLVARWSWLDYHRGGLHSSPGFTDRGEALHLSEAVSDARGRFTLAGFGPTVRGMGQVEENAPQVTAFKSGYEPFQRLVGKDPPGEIRLKRYAGTPSELAARIAAIQGDYSRGLHWLGDKPTWKSMPRMVEALHREKVRLGEVSGAQIRGANRLASRGGAGKVADARSGKGLRAEKLPGEPYWPGAVWVAWTMRRIDGRPGTARLTYSKSLPVSEEPSSFTISPWTMPGPDTAMPGWEAAKDAPPLVRVYGWSYRRSAEQRWDEAGGSVQLERVPATREAILENLRALRRDVDAELQGDRETWIANHRPLLSLLAAECRALTPDLREGICYPEASDVAAELRKPNVVAIYDRVIEDGPEQRVIGQRTVSRIEAQSVSTPRAASAGSSLTAAAAASPAQGFVRRRPVGGFSIEPAR